MCEVQFIGDFTKAGTKTMPGVSGAVVAGGLGRERIGDRAQCVARLTALISLRLNALRALTRVARSRSSKSAALLIEKTSFICQVSKRDQ
jgi:hypothetical protein